MACIGKPIKDILPEGLYLRQAVERRRPRAVREEERERVNPS